MEQQDSVWSARLDAERRTYFFDVKRTDKGDLYLSIRETKNQGEDQHDHQQLFIAEVDANTFGDWVHEAIRMLLVNAESPEVDR